MVGIAMLSAILPQLLNGLIGITLIGGALLSAVLLIVSDIIARRNALNRIIGLIVIGSFTYIVVAAPIWYFTSLAQSGQLFDLRFMGR